MRHRTGIGRTSSPTNMNKQSYEACGIIVNCSFGVSMMILCRLFVSRVCDDVTVQLQPHMVR